MKFQPLHSPEDLDSPFNRGVGFAISVGSAAVLCYITFPLIMLALKLIGL